jgi:hypothetical protein
MPSKERNRAPWEYCATTAEATLVAGIADQVIGMEVRTKRISHDALGAHTGCLAARDSEGGSRTPTHLINIRYDAPPLATRAVKEVLAAVVSGCRLHRERSGPSRPTDGRDGD